MGRDNLTNQRTDLVAQHLKCFLFFSEIPEQNLSSKEVCIIVLRPIHTKHDNYKHNDKDIVFNIKE